MQTLTDDNQVYTRPGLVISYFGNSVAVEVEDGQVFQCHLHRNQPLPVVGDRVQWRLEGDEQGIITAIEPRRSLLARGDGRGKMKPLAANIDLMLIVMAPPPIFSEYLVDRYLAAAELLHIPAMIVLNKVDLLEEDSARKAAKERLDVYHTIPYPTVLSSIFYKETLEQLAADLKQQTAVLVGPSGVGKSSLIAALACLMDIRVGDVSTRGAGKHTTTATRLYHLPEGGCVIDSPGVREFSLWSLSKKEILGSFKEFQAVLAGCQFRNCIHMAEPGCAVQTAVANGKISPARYSSYQTLMKQAHDMTSCNASSFKKNKPKR